MRIALLILAAWPLAAAEGVSGKWMMDADVVGNAFTLNCSFEQSAEAKIGGKCEVKGGQGLETVAVTGEAKSEKFIFSFTTSSGYTLEFSGAVQGDSMKGEIAVSGASGVFTGKRAAP